MDALETANKQAARIMGFFQHATQYSVYLLGVAVLLSLDVAAESTMGVNVCSMNIDFVKNNMSLGGALTFVALYSLFFSTFANIVRFFVEFALKMIAWKMIDAFKWYDTKRLDGDYWNLYGGKVRLAAARRRAIEDKDDFNLARIKELDEKIENDRKEDEFRIRMSFGSILLTALDFWRYGPDSVSTQAIHWLLSRFRDQDLSLISVGMCLLTVGAPWIFHMISIIKLEDSREPWIEHPELAREIMQKRETNERILSYADPRPRPSARG